MTKPIFAFLYTHLDKQVDFSTLVNWLKKSCDTDLMSFCQRTSTSCPNAKIPTKVITLV